MEQCWDLIEAVERCDIICTIPPLHMAVLHDDPRLVSLLLKYGADPTIKDSNGKTPLDFAKERGKTKAAEAIVRAMSSTRRRKPGRKHLHA